MCRLFIWALLAVPCSLFPLSANALTIDTVAIQRVDTFGVMIYWRTDEPSNGQIEYGIGFNDANHVSLVIDMTTEHYTPLFGLLEGEQYVTRITARGKTGGKAMSEWAAFRTLGVPAPKIIKVEVVEPSPEGGLLVWRSNTPTRGTFECGYDTSFGFEVTDPKFGQAHQVTVKRFNPRKLIHYRITAVDERGRQAPIHGGSFTTAERNVAVGAAVTGTFSRNAEPGYIKDTPPILERITDGKTEYYTGMSASGDPAVDTQWVVVDLGKIVFASDIVTLWWQLAYPKKFSVSTSLNGETWRNLGDTHDASQGTSVRSVSGDPIWEHFVHLGNVVVRYVRVEIPRGAPYERRFPKYNFVSLFELKVYPPDEQH